MGVAGGYVSGGFFAARCVYIFKRRFGIWRLYTQQSNGSYVWSEDAADWFLTRKRAFAHATALRLAGETVEWEE